MTAKKIKEELIALESKAMDLVEERIKQSGSSRILSMELYGNDSNLRGIISRAKKISPYGIATILKILEKKSKPKN